MNLGQRQEQFTSLLPLLLTEVLRLGALHGFGVRPGDLFRDPALHGKMGVKMGYGHANSCHKLKLAIDLNFVIGVRLIDEWHNEAHDYWDTLGGAKRIAHDLNHYSLEWQGFR